MNEIHIMFAIAPTKTINGNINCISMWLYVDLILQKLSIIGTNRLMLSPRDRLQVLLLVLNGFKRIN